MLRHELLVAAEPRSASKHHYRKSDLMERSEWTSLLGILKYTVHTAKRPFEHVDACMGAVAARHPAVDGGRRGRAMQSRSVLVLVAASFVALMVACGSSSGGGSSSSGGNCPPGGGSSGPGVPPPPGSAAPGNFSPQAGPCTSSSSSSSTSSSSSGGSSSSGSSSGGACLGTGKDCSFSYECCSNSCNFKAGHICE
jgi:hypothetical protein